MNLESFEELSQRRKTIKVLAQDSLPATEQYAMDQRAIVQRVLAAAGWAPFHKVCSTEHRTAGVGQLPGIEPWRFHSLDSVACRKLRFRVIHMEAAGKIPAMLASADAMIMATWLPNPPSASQHSVASAAANDNEWFEPTLGNVEHIAAASAAVQGLLLAATAAGYETYWSSGGVLRSAQIFNYLGIPTRERLLGALFLFPSNLKPSNNLEIAESKLRLERCPPQSWSRWIEL